MKDADPDVINIHGWGEQVLDWFSERLPNRSDNRRALYLWGNAGVGKTRLVDRLLRGYVCLNRDCGESFFLQGLDENYEFVWLDEFDPTKLTRCDISNQFNKLTGREEVHVRVKNGVQRDVNARLIRTVICSNHPPPQADYYQRRLYVVRADKIIYDPAAMPHLANVLAEIVG